MANFQRSSADLNSKFSLLIGRKIKSKKIRLPFYLSMSAGRIIGFISFSRLLALCEMKTALFRVSNRVTIFNQYIYIYIYIRMHPSIMTMEFYIIFFIIEIK